MMYFNQPSLEVMGKPDHAVNQLNFRLIFSRVYITSCKLVTHVFVSFLQMISLILIGAGLVFAIIFHVGTKEPSNKLAKTKVSTAFMDQFCGIKYLVLIHQQSSTPFVYFSSYINLLYYENTVGMCRPSWHLFIKTERTEVVLCTLHKIVSYYLLFLHFWLSLLSCCYGE